MNLSFFGRGLLPGLSTGPDRASAYASAVAARPAPDPAAENVIALIRAEFPELLMVAVVDTATGTETAAFSRMPSFEPATAARFNAEVVKQKKRALQAFQLDEEQIDDIIISTTSHYHIIKAVNDGQKFIYLAVLAHTTGLGLAREVLHRCALSLVK